ncbi:MAG: ABC transporter ATP-binding protein [Gammaproteobacteria bacterium]|nr:ABC transporter ATP-binding protein [Gammaproteobacteria bacterium]
MIFPQKLAVVLHLRWYKTMQREKLVEVKDLKIHAKNDDGDIIPIVKGVSFDIHKGEVVALIGESGSGKTTISLAALSYTKPGLFFAGGELLIDGEDMLQAEPLRTREIRGAKVAYLAQSAAATFNPAITIGEQVTESAVLHGILSQSEANKRATELYHALELPDPDRIGFRYPHQVSGGQLQRLMAAMALCGKPDLMVLDEPTTALDVTTQIEVLKAFKKVIQDENSAAIYVTHDLAVVAQIADYIIVLYGGEVMEQGTAAEIINNPSHVYTQRLMAAVRPKPQAGLGSSVADEHEREIPAVKATDITAGYGGIIDGEPKIPILRDINVSVKNGHVVGVIGESGCGKSTLARVMAGLLPQSRGTIELDNEELEGDLRNRNLEQLQKIQFVFQMADTALNPKQVIGDIIGRPLEFYHGLKGNARHAKVVEILEMVELPAEFASRYPMELSGGQKQRINMARSLAANPEVMLCDEVTSALDSIVGANVIKLLTTLRDKTGVSFVFISHDLSTVASFADEIVVLYAGRVVEQGPTDDVLTPPYHPYTRLLISSVPELRIGWLEDTMQKREMAVGIAKDVEITSVGCPFFNRCPMGIEGTCEKQTPPVHKTDTDHQIACHRSIEELNMVEFEVQEALEHKKADEAIV